MRILKYLFFLGLIIFFLNSYKGEILGLINKLKNSSGLISVENINNKLVDVGEKIDKTISTPPPLVQKKDETTANSKSAEIIAKGDLNPALIIEYTNIERQKEGLPALTLNSKLTASANSKAGDMFMLQYFEHISPEGKSPSDLAFAQNYNYLAIGENLALGIFKDEKDLVDAWMASPGHRANILNKHYTEIGVSAKKGIYKGDTVWMSVQEFGAPASLCDKPDESLKNEISGEVSSLENIKIQLDQLKGAISSSEGGTAEYNKNAEAYNELVKLYNAKLEEIRSYTNSYNEKVNAYNVCLKANTN